MSIGVVNSTSPFSMFRILCSTLLTMPPLPRVDGRSRAPTASFFQQVANRPATWKPPLKKLRAKPPRHSLRLMRQCCATEKLPTNTTLIPWAQSLACTTRCCSGTAAKIKPDNADTSRWVLSNHRANDREPRCSARPWKQPCPGW
jgi:hypothetical protein